MKQNSKPYGWLAATAALLLTGAAQVAQAQATDVVLNFDTDADGWTRWWGGAPQEYSWDSSVDVAGSSSSGSLKATISYDIAAYGGDNQFATQYYLPAQIDASQYTNMVFHLKFDPSSPMRGYGDYGYFEYGFIAGDYSQIWLGAVSLTDNAWHEVAGAIDPSAPKLTDIRGFVFKSWAGDTAAGAQNTLTGDSIFWVDNIVLHANTNTLPPAPPTLSIHPASAGLQIFASNPGSQYQRQNLRSIATTGLSWVGKSQPVTYSFTVGAYPDQNHTGFQTHIFLVPGENLPTYETSPDYNEPNLVFLDLQNNADGSASASFRYKTNQPSGNSMVYGAGTLANISNPTAVGKWSLTFDGDTSVTMTAPNGSSTNFALPAEAAALFNDPMYVHLGAQPNKADNIGQSVLLTDFRITEGANVLLADNFAMDAGIDTTNTWTVVAENPAGLVQVPAGSAFWVNWDAPATGFALQTSDALVGKPWVDVVSTFNLPPPVQVYKQMGTIIPASVPAANSGYFKLVKPD